MHGHAHQRIQEHTSALFNTIGRVNHDCVGNCEHFYVAEHGVMLLVASRAIARGEEISFSYVNDCATYAQRTAKLRHWGITRCDCSACAAPEGAASAALEEMSRLDAAMLAQGERGKIERALRTGRKLLQLYASHSASLMLRSRACFDLFGLVCPHDTHGCSLDAPRLQPGCTAVAAWVLTAAAWIT